MSRALRALPTLTACLCTAGVSTAWAVTRMGRIEMERTAADASADRLVRQAS